jgi:hypothetical protein
MKSMTAPIAIIPSGFPRAANQAIVRARSAIRHIPLLSNFATAHRGAG